MSMQLGSCCDGDWHLPVQDRLRASGYSRLEHQLMPYAAALMRVFVTIAPGCLILPGWWTGSAAMAASRALHRRLSGKTLRHTGSIRRRRLRIGSSTWCLSPTKCVQRSVTRANNWMQHHRGASTTLSIWSPRRDGHAQPRRHRLPRSAFPIHHFSGTARSSGACAALQPLSI